MNLSEGHAWLGCFSRADTLACSIADRDWGVREDHLRVLLEGRKLHQQHHALLQDTYMSQCVGVGDVCSSQYVASSVAMP